MVYGISLFGLATSTPGASFDYQEAKGCGKKGKRQGSVLDVRQSNLNLITLISTLAESVLIVMNNYIKEDKVLKDSSHTRRYTDK